LLGVVLCVAIAAGCGESSRTNAGGNAFGPPIVVSPADLEHWVWMSIPEMRCGDDSPGGFAVNFTNQSRELVVYLLGGGVCYDLFTCTLYQPLLHGLGEDPLAFMFGEDHSGGQAGIFDRTD